MVVSAWSSYMNRLMGSVTTAVTTVQTERSKTAGPRRLRLSSNRRQYASKTNARPSKSPDGAKASVDGAQTFGENLANDGGMAQSLNAMWSKEYKSADGATRNQLLPGITNTPGAAVFPPLHQVWCQNIHPEALYAAVASDAHAPARFRVAGTVANTPEVAKAFQCSAVTLMNPAEMCKICKKCKKSIGLPFP
ncbi:uncharacterized protein EV422DRAFT_264790 [Fimicolochytrium jonesii]|uniref:uncharacterized protein n=1 Tax=Fimicolochytrium jonesii TaxID=1396493 RepID=UPI0022FE74C9|nr:uncharacterized protein EV422DRAFT_264790 [Fimicolochytrium jonesii]KAI8816895.1 hypothetical protein EV422DRAFT_264790 [Fimicolochytrium jonesii]